MSDDPLDIVREKIRKLTKFSDISGTGHGKFGAIFLSDGVNANYATEGEAFDAMLESHFGIPPKHHHRFVCECGERHE